MHKDLEQKIKRKKAKIAVVGMGYVGLPLAHAFASKAFMVTGIDIDQKRIKDLNAGKSYIEDLPSPMLKKVIKSGAFSAQADYDGIECQDVIIICVPTPLNRYRDPDVSFIISVAEQIAKKLRPEQLIILESTTYPGTTEEIVLPILEKSGLKAGKDFFLCFSPERIDPGNPRFKTNNIPKVVGGLTAACGRLGALVYSQITPQVVPVSSPRTAEMAKLLENTFRIVNIGLINELARASKKLDIDIWEAIDAAKTKPFGFMPFYPGPGIGGHCIGVDPIFLSWKARQHGLNLDYIELSRRINTSMPRYVVSEAAHYLNKNSGKALSKSRVLILGIAYKKDVSDVRESPALDVILDLKKLGAKVDYHDPFVPSISEHDIPSMKSVPLTAASLKKYDLVILTTNHSGFNYKMIAKSSRLIFDTRNAFKGIAAKNIVRL